MDIFDDAVSKAKIAADVTVKKANELIELTKAKKKQYDINSSIKKTYCDIGILLYNASKSGDDVSDALQEKFAYLDNLNEQLKEVGLYINQLKGMKQCPDCGKGCSADSSFCNSCGSNLL